MSAQLAHILRYPIKAISAEELPQVALSPACRLPGDREWAVLTEAGERHALASETNGAPDRWLPKSCFMRGVTSAPLQAISGGWQGDTITLHHPGRLDLSFDPASEGAKLIDWLRPLWPEGAPAPTRLVKGAAIWTDVSAPWLSLLSLDSLAHLAAASGTDPGHLRWRGNLWISGLEPFAERELIGKCIFIGDAELRITQHITRCHATSASPVSGQRDTDMPQQLDRFYGHTEFGVYAEVVNGAQIKRGVSVKL